jgi:hypothetical protein
VVSTDGVSRSSRLAVAAAVVTSISGAAYLGLWAVAHDSSWPWPFIVAIVLLTATPFFARDRASLRRLCLIVAGLSVAPTVLLVGVFFGSYLFLPGALILALAPFVDRASGARLAMVTVLLAGTFSVILGVATYRTYFAPPDAFVVQTGPEFWAQPDANRVVDGSGSGIGFGALDVSVEGQSAGRARLIVSFDPGLPAAGKTALQNHLAHLTGVSEVRLCVRLRAEC